MQTPNEISTHPVRPGMQLLLNVLRGEPFIMPEAEGIEMLDLAESHGLLPYIAALLDQTALPEPVALRVQEAKRAARISAFWWTSELKGLLAAFAVAGIAVIPLKGPALAERLYGDTARRTSRDLDLLVRPDDIPATEILLAKLDFSPFGLPNAYHTGWRRGTTLVELHFDLANPVEFDLDVQGVWTRAVPGAFAGVPVLQLTAADEFLFLCAHGIRHAFDRLSYVVDIALALDRMRREAGEEIRLPGRLRRVTGLALAGYALAAHLQPKQQAWPSFASTDKARTRAERTGETIWTHLLTAHPLPNARVNLHEQRALFLATEVTMFGWLRRAILQIHGVRHLQIAFSRLNRSDEIFAARFNARRPWVVWILRLGRLIREF